MIVEPHRETDPTTNSPFIAPRELAVRWQCSRSSVDRIARRAGLSRYLLGEGRNGLVRFLRTEVEAFERRRRISTH